MVGDDELSCDYVLPDAFNKNVVENVAKAVREAAINTGVARVES